MISPTQEKQHIRERLEIFKRDLGEDSMHEAMGLFLKFVPPRLLELENAFLQHDYDQAQKSAHSLKGSLSNFGARGLADLCDQFEFSCQAPGVEEERDVKLMSLLGEIKNGLNEVTGYLTIQLKH